jgi:hypothetical protein
MARALDAGAYLKKLAGDYRSTPVFRSKEKRAKSEFTSKNWVRILLWIL